MLLVALVARLCIIKLLRITQHAHYIAADFTTFVLEILLGIFFETILQQIL